jgi:hypothetical protein
MQNDDDEFDHVANNPNSIAEIFYKLYGNKFRYLGKRSWEYKDIRGDWNKDKNMAEISRAFIQLSMHALKRSIYWSNQGDNEVAMSHRDRLLTISTKLKSSSMRLCILKEAREYFVSD